MSQVLDRVATRRERIEVRRWYRLLRLEGIGPLQQDAAGGCGIGVAELQRSRLSQELDRLASEFLAS